MNLGQICFSTPRSNKAPLSEINTADAFFTIHENMDGSKEIKYHVNIIELLDKVFQYNTQDFLSLEQDRFIDKFYKQAGVVTDNIKNNTSNPYKNMDSVMKQLDAFLGSYFGENNGKYAR